MTLIQTEARMYLAGQRSGTRSGGQRSFHTFGAGGDPVSNRGPFGDLRTLDENTLSAECSCEVENAVPGEIILIPLAGALEVWDGVETTYVDSGETLTLGNQAGQTYRITNPYPDQAVHYLHISRDSVLEIDRPASRVHFDLSIRNTLLPAYAPASSKNHVFIGKYQGRAEGIYRIRHAGTRVFIFIIEGAFEVQNRLLERRDGLSLENIEEVAFEALSNDAILLLLEC